MHVLLDVGLPVGVQFGSCPQAHKYRQEDLVDAQTRVSKEKKNKLGLHEYV